MNSMMAMMPVMGLVSGSFGDGSLVLDRGGFMGLCGESGLFVYCFCGGGDLGCVCIVCAVSVMSMSLMSFVSLSMVPMPVPVFVNLDENLSTSVVSMLTSSTRRMRSKAKEIFM
jgi:hypothetical protein